MAYTDIDDPSEYFQTLLYTGNGANNRALVNDGNSDLQPDWIWFKERNSTSVHQLLDSSRGVNKALSSNDTGGEETYAYLSSFDSNGFTFDQSDGSTNENNNTFVAWQWKVNGGTTTTNDASSTGIGDIDSVIQANQTAGISIVTYTGTDTAGETFAHGLGAIPDMVIIKRRGADGDAWAVQLATTLGNTNALRLNETSAYGGGNGVGFWNDTSPTSTVMSLGDRAEVNSASTNTYVGYFFKSIQGYSKIGKYVGNGNADGTFVYLGFKPAWVLVKSVDVAQSWQLSDSARNPSNVVNRRLAPNDASAESTAHSWIDFLSNGFKIRINDAAYNNNAQDYIYMAFAEHPFVSSKGVPTTAR